MKVYWKGRNGELQATATSDAHPGQSCPRCAGLLVEDYFMDIAQDGFLWETGCRCVNCGNVLFSRPARTHLIETAPDQGEALESEASVWTLA